MPNRHPSHATQTHVGKLLKRCAQNGEPAPEIVQNLPVYTDYHVRLDAIKAGVPQQLLPREFLRFLLLDDPAIGNNPDRIFAVNLLERELGYQRNSMRRTLLSPQHLRLPLPTDVTHAVRKLSRTPDSFWEQATIDSGQAASISFFGGIDRPAVTQRLAITPSKDVPSR